MEHGRTFTGGAALLSVAEMARADAETIAAGTPGEQLMENAGASVAAAAGALAASRDGPRTALVLCGPGNNGGDGWVAARRLAADGWSVRLASLVDRAALTGDAAHHAGMWSGPVEPIDAAAPPRPDAGAIVIDSLFGAGLARPLSGAAAAAVAEVNAARSAGRAGVVAVDVPSGLDGDSGRVLGAAGDPLEAALDRGLAIAADRCVTFFRAKPGHVLLPGRGLCGALTVADIGIAEAVLSEIGPRAARNDPELWADRLPRLDVGLHKYSRGHLVILGGAQMTGAARLAARAAMRAGAGMVTVASPPEARRTFADALENSVVVTVRDTASFTDLVDAPRCAACLVGPGAGVIGATRERAMAALRSGKPAVLDADALSVFEHTRELLFENASERCLLTPHEGEFARLFDDLPEVGDGADKLVRARAGARRSGAVVLLKGPDTVIAHPSGAAVVNANAPPTLATAGAGDVLAGIAVSLLAQGMATFDAAAAAAWIHGAAAQAFGRGLIASDLPDLLPAVMAPLIDADTPA